MSQPSQKIHPENPATNNRLEETGLNFHPTPLFLFYFELPATWLAKSTPVLPYPEEIFFEVQRVHPHFQ